MITTPTSTTVTYLDSVVVAVGAAPGHLQGEHRPRWKREETMRRVLHTRLLQLRQK